MRIEVNSEIAHDLELVCASIVERRQLDPVVARRVQERAEFLRSQLPETNVAVELIREVRDEE